MMTPSLIQWPKLARWASSKLGRSLLRRVAGGALLGFFLVSCAAAPATFPTAPATAAPTVAPQASLPTWQTASLVDVRNGQAFTLADFKGKTVYVEPMATWCTNCRAQLTNVRQLISTLKSPDDYVFVSLSVETDLKPEDLAAYVQRTGFDWHFAVLSPQLLADLSAAFGRAITNPPSTPHFVIYPDGTTSALRAGAIDSPEALLTMLTTKGS